MGHHCHPQQTHCVSTIASLNIEAQAAQTVSNQICERKNVRQETRERFKNPTVSSLQLLLTYIFQSC